MYLGNPAALESGRKWREFIHLFSVRLQDMRSFPGSEQEGDEEGGLRKAENVCSHLLTGENKNF